LLIHEKYQFENDNFRILVRSGPSLKSLIFYNAEIYFALSTKLDIFNGSFENSFNQVLL